MRGTGAHVRVRTGDLVLTKDVLCLLSYVGPRIGHLPAAIAGRTIVTEHPDLGQPSVYLGKSGYRSQIRPAGSVY